MEWARCVLLKRVLVEVGETDHTAGVSMPTTIKVAPLTFLFLLLSACCVLGASFLRSAFNEEDENGKW